LADLTDHGAYGANTLEIGVTGKIVASRPRSLRWREQARRTGDQLSGRESLAFAHRDPHPFGPLGFRDILHFSHAQKQPLSLLTVVYGLDEARDWCDDDPGECGRRHAPGADHTGREAGEERGERDQGGKDG
jgi:hypothetical protein